MLWSDSVTVDVPNNNDAMHMGLNDGTMINFPQVWYSNYTIATANYSHHMAAYIAEARTYTFPIATQGTGLTFCCALGNW